MGNAKTACVMENQGKDVGLVHDRDCERTLLNSLLQRPPLLHEVREHLTPECFHDLRLQDMFEAMVAIADRGDPLSYITLNAELQKCQSLVDLDFITDMMFGDTVTDVVTYALRLKDLACRRRLWEVGKRLVQAGISEADDILDVQMNARDELDNLLVSGTTGFTTLADKFAELKEIIMRNRSGCPVVAGTPTGYSELDRRGGLMPSALTVIAGESSHGKTAFAMSLVVSAICNGCGVAVYTMEMTALELTARITAMRSGVSSLALMQRPLFDIQAANVDAGMASLPMDRLFFDEKTTSGIDSILASIRTMKLKHGIGGVVVDYIQILNVNMHSANVEQQMASVARRLKNIALELDIWVLCLSQLNRDRNNPYPTLARLRDSGQIAEAADNVMFVFRPEESNCAVKKYPEPFEQATISGTAMINVAKGRNIGTFRFLCGFRKETTEFYELSTIPQREESGTGSERNPNLPF